MADFVIEENNIPLYKEQFNSALEEAFEVLGKTIERYAIDRCPVGTPESTGIPNYKGGSLKSTIRSEVHMDKKEMEVLAGGKEGLYKYVNYAYYVEAGTRKMRAQPYMKPAVDEHQDEIKGIVHRAFGN